MFLMVFVYIVILYRTFKIDQKHVLVPARKSSVFNRIIWKINFTLLHFFVFFGTFNF